MNQRELEYKRDLIGVMRSRRWHVQEHEDKQSLFIPDLSAARSGIDVWIEVKYRDKVPTRLHAMKHWTAGQEQWLINRGQSGRAACFLLLGTPRRHLLWKHDVLRQVRSMPMDIAIVYCWARELTLDGLVCALQRLARG